MKLILIVIFAVLKIFFSYELKINNISRWDIMQRSLNKLFKTIDDLDENKNITEFYKKALLFEFDVQFERVPFRRIRNEYDKMINRHLEEDDES